jgi:ADP-ribose pyrophosphatase YjhB (NUDIX family)/chorismate mutase
MTNQSPEKSPFKFCPICGKETLKKARDGLILCQNCQFEWYQNPTPAANVILTNSKGEILLGKRTHNPRKGAWGTIGGFVEVGDNLENNLLREVKEEIGVELEMSQIRYFCSNTDRYQYQFLNYQTLGILFTAVLTEKQISQMKPLDDVSEIRFFDPKDFPWKDIAFESGTQTLQKFIHQNYWHNKTVTELRTAIDSFDQEILQTLAKRQQVVAAVGNLKKTIKMEPHDPKRWQEVEKNIQATAVNLNLDPDITLKIWELIHLNSLRIERKS